MFTLDTSCKGLKEERNDSDGKFSPRHVHLGVVWARKDEDKKEGYDVRIRKYTKLAG